MASKMTPKSLRVGLLGHGAIGSAVAAGLEAGKVENAELSAVLDPWAPHPSLGVGSLQELLAVSDVVVEAAGHDALREHGCEVRAAGADLLVVSVGALADEELYQDLLAAGGLAAGGRQEAADAAGRLAAGGLAAGGLAAGGRQEAAEPADTSGKLYITTGAIGGFDTLKAVALAGAIHRAEITSRKPAANLVRPWMAEALREELLAEVSGKGRTASAGKEETQGSGEAAGSGEGVARRADTKAARAAGEIIAFSGSAREACRLFPQSANVCATLSLATLGFDKTQATMVGDPARKRVRHEIRVEAESGVYEFAFENITSPSNPKTSAVVPYAVLRGLSSLAAAVPKDGLQFV